MARRSLSESGYYHISTRTAGQIAMFEDDADRRRYLHYLKDAHDAVASRIIAWVLMSNHVHLVVDFGDHPEAISEFMYRIDKRYTRYFNAKTGRTGTLFQGGFWSKSIDDDAQLAATVHYVHMNPEAAHVASMRSYHWSSYQEYLGTHWIVDTSTILDMFGSFEAFDCYEGSDDQVVRRVSQSDQRDGDALEQAMRLAGVSSSDELRRIPKAKRNELICTLLADGVSQRRVARTFGIGPSTVSRIAKAAHFFAHFFPG